MLQARVPEETSRVLRDDIETLGLAGTSEAIREALALLHHKAQMVALGKQYDEFYEGEPAPASDVTAALYSDEE